MQETTLTHGDQTLTFKNSMGQYIEFRLMMEKFASNGLPDESFRENFCFIMGFAVSIFGAGPWRHVTSVSTPEEFEEAWQHWCEHGTDAMYHDALMVINALRSPAANEIEKPDHAVTNAEEESDPN